MRVNIIIMDSFNYFNELEAYNQARQLYETYEADKDSLIATKDDTVGGLGLAGSGEILSKSLLSDTVKTALKNALKTGNNDVDSAVEKTVGDISADSNPIDVVSNLISQIKPIFQQSAGDFVRSAIARITGRPQVQSEIFGSDRPSAYSSMDVVRAESNIDQTFQNPVFDAGDLVDGESEGVLDSLSSKAGSLANEIQARASGVAEDAISKVSQAFGNLRQRASGILEDTQSQAQDAVSRIQNFASDQADVAMARLNPSGSTSNQIGDLLRQGNININQTSEAESSDLSSTIDDLASTGKSLIDPTISDTIPDSIQSAISSTVDGASDALSGITSGVSDALLGASSVEEGVGAVLDGTPLAPLGILIGLLGLGGSLGGILDHHISKPSFNGATPAFEPGL